MKRVDVQRDDAVLHRTNQDAHNVITCGKFQFEYWSRETG